MRSRNALVCALVVLAACKPSARSSATTGPSSPGTATGDVPPIDLTNIATRSRPISAGVCGTMPCELFDSPEAAFDRVLESQPLVLGVGETHAQKDDPPVPSATKRFADTLLPRLDGKARDMVIELWVANGKCGQKTEKQVATQQADVTKPQAATNQSEFFQLGNVAKAHNIFPQALVPNCGDYARILDAGSGDVGEMLAMIARVTGDTVLQALEKKRGMVVAYGGALHNDIAPAPGREAMSFGPRLDKETHEKYVELDLIVPEFVKDNEVWKSFAWHAQYDRKLQGNKTILFEPTPGSFILIFPPTRDLGSAKRDGG